MRQQLLINEIGEAVLRKGLVGEGMIEKPKHRAAEAERVLLSDDGELIPVDEDESIAQKAYNTRNKNN